MAQPVYMGMAPPVLGSGGDTVDLSWPPDVRPNDILVAGVITLVDVGGLITSFNASSDFPNTIASTSLGLRRGLVAAWRVATGYEVGTTTFSVTTTSGDGVCGGTVGIIRGGLTVGGIHSATAMGMTSSSLPAPGDVTTTDTDEAAFALIAYRNTDTITDINANGWAQGEAAQNDGTNSFSFQYLWVPTATTITGGAATLGTSGSWGVISFAVKALYPEGTDRFQPTADFVSVG